MQTCCAQNTQCETGAAKMDAYERIFPQRVWETVWHTMEETKQSKSAWGLRRLEAFGHPLPPSPLASWPCALFLCLLMPCTRAEGGGQRYLHPGE